MNSEDQSFLEKLRITFQIEAEEHLNALTQYLLLLEQDLPADKRQEIVEKIFREAHSLKGASHAVNHETIQQLCQVLEDIFSKWKQNALEFTPDLFDQLHQAVDLLLSELKSRSNPQKINAMAASLSSLLNPSKPDETEQITEEQKPPLPQKPQEIQESPPANPSAVKTIRISSSKLDHLFQEAEELLMIKLTTRQEMEAIKNLSTLVNKQEKELTRFLSEIQMQKQAQGAESLKTTTLFFEKHQIGVKSLNAQLKKLMKSSQQSMHFAHFMVDTLLEDIKKTLMQPISSLYEVFPRMVRDISRKLGKEIQLEVSGGDIEVDRRILEEIKDPMIHIIRNAIDHGIELPQERVKKKKKPTGKITITAQENQGSTILLTIEDDGQGINIEKLKKVALEKKIITTTEAENLTQDEAIKLAFQSGISTSSIISDISGRGIGLGVVTEKVEKLAGKMIIESIPDKGTIFKFIFPLTMATFRGVHIAVEGEDFIMPAQNIQRVIRIKEDQIKTVEGCETLMVGDHALSFLRLADVLGIEKKPPSPETRYNRFALLIKAEDKTIAFGVDHIHQEHEVLLKSLGSHCPRVKNIMAATIMDWGKVIPILNPIDLVRTSLKAQFSRKASMENQDGITTKKVILLAEDSITTRLLIKNILESSGYEVKSAVDGLEAFEMIKTENIDLLLTDVDMPRMDGFTLSEKVRKIDKLKDLPIIICTARGSSEDRLKGIEIGANAYLDKSSFDQQSLLNLTKKLL